MSWLGGDTMLHSSRELKQVDMYVYTNPGGLLGRLMGRALRFSVKDFSFYMRQKGELQRVVVAADSLVPQCEVFQDTRQERTRLGYQEAERLTRRTTKFTLEAARYPTIEFQVDKEKTRQQTAPPKKKSSASGNAVEELPPVVGTLSLRGESHPIRCSRVVDGAEMIIDCPLSLSRFNIPKYKLWLGLFTVGDEVTVQTRVPVTALKL
ncbi:hypothetical protein AGDE_07837 [Angomonas deanei]|uniref:YceI-like domain containing protein, putative n=1 Tax=Angomonas deanei TaxID=59799 RepID=A0A7G2CLT0_9TRYP|nr:hypothetical protein AGDE_07837 [Angomonas deanei]CAD2220776.1 YceI-like domain containing protein, putative [Angomonas deanei]|eukprot:EPY34592.1 hypothetical protein AGDE_07837 [Angomonas deanei]